MDDFTFPAIATAAEPADPLCLHHHRLPFPHLASSPLWFHAAAVAATPVVVVSRAVGMEEQEPAPGAGRPAEGERGEDEQEDEEGDEEVVRGGGGGVGGEDKMDLLWENFNEELEALRRSGSFSKAASGLELSDTESEPAERGLGCAPMLRAAGGTGHYGRATNWVLLMRIFKRLFVVEKTITAARRRQARPE